MSRKLIGKIAREAWVHMSTKGEIGTCDLQGLDVFLCRKLFQT